MLICTLHSFFYEYTYLWKHFLESMSVKLMFLYIVHLSTLIIVHIFFYITIFPSYS